MTKKSKNFYKENKNKNQLVNLNQNGKSLTVQCGIDRYADKPWFYLPPTFCKEKLITLSDKPIQWLQITNRNNPQIMFIAKPMPNYIFPYSPCMQIPGKFYTFENKDIFEKETDDYVVKPIKYQICEKVVIEFDLYAIDEGEWTMINTAFYRVPLSKGLKTVVRTEKSDYNLIIKEIEPIDQISIINLDKTDVKVKLHIKYDHKYEYIFERISTLIVGPVGIGKSYQVEEISKQLNIPLVVCRSIDSLSQCLEYTNFLLLQSENCILYIREIDKLAPKESNSDQKEFAEKLVNLNSKVSLIASAINGTDIYEFLKFTKTILAKCPEDRGQVIKEIWPFRDRELNNKILETFKASTNGYLPIDIYRIIEQVTLDIYRNHKDDENDEHLFDDLASQFEKALRLNPPTLLKEYRVSETGVSWDQLGGLFKVKPLLEQYLEWPFTRSELFKKIGLTPPRGILLYGPPGCSKTCIAKAIASKNQFTFCALDVGSIFSAFVGESERLIREVFMQARLAQPAIIFVDEIDAIVGGRNFGSKGGDVVQERILTTFLTEMDGIGGKDSRDEKVIVLAATNRIDAIDVALKRPGRFDLIIKIDLPDKEERIDILKVFSNCNNVIIEDEVLEYVSEETGGWSGAGLKNLFCKAKSHNFITKKDFENAFKEIAKTRLSQNKILFSN